MEQNTKTCSKCHQELPLTMFNKRSTGSRDGYSGICKKCKKPDPDKLNKINQRRREIYALNKEKINQKNRERYANDEEYKAKKIKSSATYRERHREELRCNSLQYYYEYFDEIKEKKKLYNELHKEEILQWQKQYREKNKDELNSKHREYWKRYYIDNKYQILNKNRLSKEKRNSIEGVLLQEQINECLMFFNNICAYSGQPFGEDTIDNLTLDHIIPLNSGGTNYIWNIVPSRRTCNSSKGAREMLDWYTTQDFYSEERLQKILEWQEYAYNKWGNEEIAC